MHTCHARKYLHPRNSTSDLSTCYAFIIFSVCHPVRLLQVTVTAPPEFFQPYIFPADVTGVFRDDGNQDFFLKQPRQAHEAERRL